MKPTITKTAFLDFFFSTDEEKEDYGRNMVNELINKGIVSTTIENVYENVGYIPAHICENLTEEQLQDENLEFEPNEVELIED